MIDIDNQTSLEVNTTTIENIANTLTQKDIELLITSNKEIQKINNQYRAKNTPTDVLSFPYEPMPMAPLGSIVISADFVMQKAKEFHHSTDAEFTLLFIHGLLHLLGYDHEVDDGEMRAKEWELIQQFNLPESLIIRTQG